MEAIFVLPVAYIVLYCFSCIVKGTYVVTCSKRSPFSYPVIENVI